MGYTYVVNELESHIPVFENLLNNKSKSEYLWRPKPEKWCLLEIICHLYDEEREDFRARVKHTLEKPTEPLAPIDPVTWVSERDYISKDYNNTLEAFLAERKASVKWLKTIASLDWEQGIVHPELGMLRAKIFLANWLAHDYLHIRQIIRYQFEYLKVKTEVDLNYAGNW